MKKLGKGDMTVRELGKLGGLARGAKCTAEQLSAIGRLGYAAGLAKYSTAERRKWHRKGEWPPLKLTEKKIARIKKLFKSGWTQTQIAEALDVTRPTIRRHLHRGIWRRTVK